ncbi:hypothetical protein GCM10010171_02320 [Actinokineospora fastidiosa]|uniref:Uncharacterized protein n=2 Tax=Actinokineospora fastidiosa TaxID=1816 RepID=A0A918G2A7_9PSEU|nr:hypothetical protein GCM10010171_02320 [Actinokineospora fastidiosa]
MNVLTVGAVKAAISALKAQRIHEHFPAYLQLRKLAVTSGSLVNLAPEWRDVGDLLKMPGGPPTKPHYRPFSSRKRKDESTFWYNKNLAGSYAPKSMRATSRFMLNADGDGYELPTNHAQQALTALLQSTRVPAWAFAAYCMRNYGFTFDGTGGYEELLAGFKSEFAFESGSDFEVLFEDSEPSGTDYDWFESLSTLQLSILKGNKEGIRWSK